MKQTGSEWTGGSKGPAAHRQQRCTARGGSVSARTSLGDGRCSVTECKGDWNPKEAAQKVVKFIRHNSLVAHEAGSKHLAGDDQRSTGVAWSTRNKQT
eukprot:766902-Hanusia_phi.AAC.4